MRLHLQTSFLQSMKIKALFSALLSSLLTLASCASVGNYNPDPETVFVSVNEISVKNAVKAINNQPSTTDHELGFRGIIVNYNTYTQLLADALNARYKAENTAEENPDKKELQVAITNIEMSRTDMNFRAFIDAEVKYGDNKTEVFNISRASFASGLMVDWFPTKPLDSALEDLLTEILTSNNIVSYIDSQKE